MMKILVQMIRYYRPVLLGLPAILAIGAAIERTFEISNVVVLLWVMSAIFLGFNGASYKAFFTVNYRWLSSLPISRIRFVSIAVLELVFNACLVVYSLILTLLIHAWMLPTAESASSIIEKPAGSPITTASLLVSILSLVISSPALFSWQFGKLGWQKIIGWSTGAHRPNNNTIAWSIIAVAAVFLYLAPDATSYLIAGLFSAGLGAISWHQLFLTQKSWRQAKAYAAAIIASVLGIFFLQTEVIPPPNERPVARAELYGDLAPQLSRADLMRSMSQEKESDEKLARFAKSGLALPNEKRPIALEELRAWLKQSEENPKAFVHGLTMFNNDIWDQPALELLESGILKRCPGGLHTSSFKTHLICQIDARLNQMLTIKVKSLEVLYDLLKPEHPLLSALALSFMTSNGVLSPMREKVHELAQSKNEVLAHRARLALLRLHGNGDAEKWLCANEALSGKFKCDESNLIQSPPLLFETRSARATDSFARLEVLDWQKPE